MTKWQEMMGKSFADEEDVERLIAEQGGGEIEALETRVTAVESTLQQNISDQTHTVSITGFQELINIANSNGYNKIYRINGNIVLYDGSSILCDFVGIPSNKDSTFVTMDIISGSVNSFPALKFMCTPYSVIIYYWDTISSIDVFNLSSISLISLNITY